MATSSDSKVIDRESTHTGLVDRYNSQKVGGSFDAKKDVKTSGNNETSLGGSTFDSNYTKTKGFKINMQPGVSELSDINGNKSNELSRHIKGFNNKKYNTSTFSK
jgi:hypothetical protein